MKPLVWIASSKKGSAGVPDEVQDVFGFALHLAQSGLKHEQAKPLKGQGSAAVLEVVEDDLAEHAGLLKTEPAGSEMAQLARDEIAQLQTEEQRLTRQLQLGLAPPDPRAPSLPG